MGQGVGSHHPLPRWLSHSLILKPTQPTPSSKRAATCKRSLSHGEIPRKARWSSKCSHAGFVAGNGPFLEHRPSVCADDLFASDDQVATGAFRIPIQYPRIPGHEIVGDVVAIPLTEKAWKLGQRVGGGWHGGHCLSCSRCRLGDYITCEKKTINGAASPASGRSSIGNRVHFFRCPAGWRVCRVRDSAVRGYRGAPGRRGSGRSSTTSLRRRDLLQSVIFLSRSSLRATDSYTSQTHCAT